MLLWEHTFEYDGTEASLQHATDFLPNVGTNYSVSFNINPVYEEVEAYNNGEWMVAYCDDYNVAELGGFRNPGYYPSPDYYEGSPVDVWMGLRISFDGEKATLHATTNAPFDENSPAAIAVKVYSDAYNLPSGSPILSTDSQNWVDGENGEKYFTGTNVLVPGTVYAVHAEIDPESGASPISGNDGWFNVTTCDWMGYYIGIMLPGIAFGVFWNEDADTPCYEVDKNSAVMANWPHITIDLYEVSTE